MTAYNGDGGNNVLGGGAGADALNGMAGNDTLYGGGGNDTLDGGTGVDSMVGGAGDDLYFVDDANDVIVEDAGANGGYDSVKATVGYTLSDNIEKLVLVASAGTGPLGVTGLAGTGNAGANLISGTAYNDTLDGGAGADTMVGGTGDDTYYVDSTGDVVRENMGEGTDTVATSLSSYTLGDNVENLTVTSAGSFVGTGNGLDNVITGGASADSLYGGAGADTLVGGGGDDLLDGGAGDDTAVFGGPKADYQVSSDGAGGYYVQNVGTEGEGRDHLVNVEYVKFSDGPAIALSTFAPGISVTGTASADTLYGSAAGDTIRGAAGNDLLFGGAKDPAHPGQLGPDGGAGNDSLDGGQGADTMVGGLGDDIYVVDSAPTYDKNGVLTSTGDVVIEAAGGGTDTIQTALAGYTLAAGNNVERLVYTGTGTFNGTGNELGNYLLGGGGADTLSDGGVNTGGAGADTLVGGTGNDLYFVNNSSDIIVEQAGSAGGVDTVRTSVDYVLGDNVENLVLTVGGHTATGNALNNLMAGSSGDDTLDGGAGADTLQGGVGNDTYVIDSTGDVIQEVAGGGTDTVRTTLSTYTLGANLENLAYTGTGAFAGTGNTLANQLTGGAGNDSLYGGTGDDTLTGGAGNDSLDGGVGTDTAVFSGKSTEYTVTKNANGSVTVAHTGGAHTDGTDTLVNVERAQFTDGTYSLTANNAPTAVADAFSGAEDNPINGNVLTNDYDFDHNTLTAVLANGPAHGQLVFNTDGSFTYTPAANFNGADSFTYQAKDTAGALSAATTVSLTVTPVNDAPVANPDAASIDQNATASVTGNVLSNDTDVENDPLTATLNGSSHGTYGNLTLTSDGSYSYALSGSAAKALGQGATGTDTFSYTASDGHGGTSTSTLTVTVVGENDAPTTTAISGGTHDQNDATFTQNLLANASDPDTGDTLSVSNVSASATDGQGHAIAVPTGAYSVSGSTLTLNPSAFAGLGAGQSETVTFGYTVSDTHAATAAGSYTVTIQGENDAVHYTAASPTSQSVTEDANVDVGDPSTPALVAAPGSIAFADPDTTDTHSLAVTYTLTGSDAHAQAVANALVAGTDFSANGAVDESGHAVDYQWLVANNAVQGLGQGESITLVAHLGLSDASTHDTRDVTLVVNGAEDAPVANSDNATTTFGTPVTIDVLHNDTDADGDTLMLQSVGQGAHGTVTIQNGEAVYTPNAGVYGSDSFTYTVSDGQQSAVGTVNVTVTGPVSLTENGVTTYYGTIQAAVNAAHGAAADGDVIHVAAGTYREQVTINGKEIQILGAGLGQTVIEAPDAANLQVNATDPVASNHDKFAVVAAIGGADLTLSDVTVDGRDQAPSDANAYDLVGVFGLDSNVKVESSHVTGIRDTASGAPSGVQHDTAIIVRDTTGAAHTATIADTAIDGFQKNAVSLYGAGLTVDVHGNTITGAGDIATTAQNGIQVSAGATGDIGHNTISGIDYTGTASATAANILVINTAGVSVHDNTVQGGQGVSNAGVYFSNVDGGSAHGNTLEHLTYGLIDQGAFTTPVAHTASGADDNSFSDDGTAIGFYPSGAHDYAFTGSAGGDDLEGASGADTLSGAAGDDFLVGGGGANSLSGGDGTDTAYYAGAPGDYVITQSGGSFTSVSGDGSTDTLSSVEQLSFGNGSTLTAGAPVNLYDHGGHLVGTFAHIQDAIDAADGSGETITVAAGTYAENLVIAAGKTGLTIEGANAGVDPNTGARGAESLITGAPASHIDSSAFITVRADGVTIKGFELQGQPGVSGALYGISNGNDDDGQYPSVNGLTVQNNVISGVSGWGVQLYNGDTGTPTAADISHNLFENMGGMIDATYHRTAILLYDNAYATVHDNVMNGVGVGVQTGNMSQAAPAGFTPSISDNQITADHVGIFNNLQYGAATGFAIDGDTITAAAGNDARAGVLDFSIDNGVSNTFTGDAVSGFHTGYEIWNDAQPVTISGGSVAGADVGVSIADTDVRYGAAGASTSATVSGVAFSGNGTDVQVHDGGVDGVSTSVTLANSTSSASGGAVTVSVEGSQAGFATSGQTAPLHVAGSAADETLTGGAGNDSIDGGAGTDTVTYAGNRADYAVTLSADGSSATVSGAQGTDTLTHVEHIAFADATDDLSDRVRVFDSAGHLVGTYADAQTAVDAAASGDTVKLAAGTYDFTSAPLTITKSLTIAGANAGVAGTDDAHRGAESVIQGPAGGGKAIEIADDSTIHVTFDGVQVTGNHLLDETNQTISFTNSVFDLNTTADNAFYMGYQPGGSFSFTDNKLTETGYSNVFELFGGTHVTVGANDFEGVAGTYAAGADNNVPLVLNINGDGTVTGNTFHHVDIGVLVGSVDAGGLSITGNTFDDLHRAAPNTGGGLAAGVAIVGTGGGAIYSGALTISDNSFESVDAAVRTTSYSQTGAPTTLPSTPIVIGNDTVDGGLVGSVNIGGVLHLSDLHGSSAIASSEFFGGTSDDSISGDAGVTNALYGGAGNDTLSGSTANDRLDGGAGADTATYGVTLTAGAITPDGAGGYVVHAGAEGTDTLSGVETVVDGDGRHIFLVSSEAQLQAAAGSAVAGDVIEMAAGTYTGDVTFSHGVTVNGAQAGVGTAGRDAATGVGESTIVGHVTVTGGDDVTLDGLRFLNDGSYGSGPANPTLAFMTAGDGAGHVVENSIFYASVMGGANGVDDRAIFVSGAATGTVTVENDLITGSSNGAYATASWGRGVWTDGGGDHLDVHGTTFETVRSGVNIDNAGGSTADIHDNTFHVVGTAVSVGIDDAGVTIAGNTLDTVYEAFNFKNLPTDVTFDAATAGTVVAPAGGGVAVYAGAGADSISGTAGGDLLDGNNASSSHVDSDHLDGRAGNDTLAGEAGDDVLTGGAGNDLLYGGAGIDTADGYAGTTAITISGGQWIVTDSAGSDTLSGVEKVVANGHGYELVGDGGFTSVQAAIDAAQDGDVILIAPGTYNETAASQGTSFGLVVDKAVTLQGVDASGAAITSASAVAATIVSGAESSFGTNFYVTASNVTISGLGFDATNNPGVDGAGRLNKAIEVVGDHFTLTHSTVGSSTVPDVGTSVYIDDLNAPAGPSYVSSISAYDVSDNILNGDVAVSNGAGHGHDASGLLISGNHFVLNPNSDTNYNWGIILDGQEAGVSYRGSPIANPTVSGNTFDASYTQGSTTGAQDGGQRLHAIDSDVANLPTRAYVDAFVAQNGVGDYAFATNTDGSIHAVAISDPYQAGATEQTFDVWVTASDASAAAASGDTLHVLSTGAAVQTIVTDGLQVELREGSANVNLLLGSGVHSLQLRDFGAGQGIGAHVQANDLGDSLIGAAGEDTLVGGAGSDTLNGGGGGDLLTGGQGSDLFNFSSANGVADEITDFVHGVDKIGFNSHAFGVPDDAIVGFRVDADPTTHNPTLIYHSATGELDYDADGSGPGSAVAIARLDGHPTLSAGDLFIY